MKAIRILRVASGLGLVAVWLATGRIASAAIIDVTSYGASTLSPDNTAAINNAINAAVSGDTVLIPSGTFNVAGTITPKSGIILAGAGMYSTALLYNGTALNPMINMPNLSNVELTGFTLNANNSVNAAQGINAYGGGSDYIHGIRVENLVANSQFGPHGIYFSSGVTNSRIVGNDFENIGVNSDWGAGIRLSNGSSGTQVLNNTIANTGRGGILCDNNTTDLVIKNNTISGSGLSPGGPGLGIELFAGCDRSLVQGNHLDHWLSVGGASDSAIRGNTLTPNSPTDVKFIGLELATAGTALHDLVFANNTVNGGAQIGISVSGSDAKDHVLWAHNTIQGAVTWGAQIQGEGGGASHMYFYGNTFAGTTGGPNPLYTGQGNGFRFNGNSYYMEFYSNQIINNANIGFQSGDSSSLNFLRVVNNTISNNGGPSFTYDYGAVGPFVGSDLRWQNNTVSGNGVDYSPPSQGTFFDNSPSAAIVAPLNGTVGQPVNFGLLFADATGYTLDHVLWDFGDGLPAMSPFASYTYSTPGNYVVDVVAWDNAGRAAFNEIHVGIFSQSSVPEPSILALLALGGLLMRRARRR